MWELKHKKTTEHWRAYTFELCCWRRLSRVPWTARRSNQSILKEVKPEYSLARLMLKLKLQYFGHLMWRSDSLKRPWCWERLQTEGEGAYRGWDDWMESLTQWTWVWASSWCWWWTGKPGLLHEVTKSRTWLSSWTTYEDTTLVESGIGNTDFATLLYKWLQSTSLVAQLVKNLPAMQET